MLKQTFSLRKAVFRRQYTLFIYTRRHEKAPVHAYASGRWVRRSPTATFVQSGHIRGRGLIDVVSGTADAICKVDQRALQLIALLDGEVDGLLVTVDAVQLMVEL